MQSQQNDNDLIYLLANHRYHKKKDIVYSIDNEIHLLLQKKFFNLGITFDDYNQNIQKIETLFMETYIQKIIGEIINTIDRNEDE